MKILKIIPSILIILLGLLILLGNSNIGNKDISSIDNQFSLLELKNNTIRYRQIGSGKDILFIHGTPGSLEDWDPIIDSLSIDYRVTAFDRLGHGYSSSNSYKYHLKENAQLVSDIIQELELKSPMIIGHSYGGSTVAHLVTNQYNDQLKYMIIDSPLFSYEPSLSLKLLSTPLIGKAFAFIANYTIAPKFIQDGIIASTKNQTSEQIENLIAERQEIWLQPKVLYSKAMESKNYDQDLKNILTNYHTISSDLTVVTGNDSDDTFLSDAKSFSDIVSSDSLVILNNTGHYIQFDQSEELLKLIKYKMKE